MAHLSYPDATEVQLRLEAKEEAILAVVRKCPWWLEANVEGRFPGSKIVSAITLTAERRMNETIREIMLRSFQIVFPPEGGEGTLAETKVAQIGRRPIR